MKQLTWSQSLVVEVNQKTGAIVDLLRKWQARNRKKIVAMEGGFLPRRFVGVPKCHRVPSSSTDHLDLQDLGPSNC